MTIVDFRHSRAGGNPSPPTFLLDPRGLREGFPSVRGSDDGRAGLVDAGPLSETDRAGGRSPTLGLRRFGAIDRNVDESNTPQLTPRERRCLELVARHFDSEAIGAELGIAAGTVNRYIHDATRKLGARNRKEAARMLQEMDALGPPPSENWVRNEWVAPAPPPVPTIEPQSMAAPVTGWRRLLYFERPVDPAVLGPGKRLVAMVGILLALSLGLGFAVIAAAGLMAIYGHLRF